MNWKSELKKCLLDKSRKYMIEKYALQNEIWDMHPELLDMINNNKYVVVTKSRNVGFTSLMAAYVACEMVLNSDGNNDIYRVRYIPGNCNTKYDFISLVKQYISNIPLELYTCEKFIIKEKGDELHLGKAILTIKGYNTEVFESEYYDLIIYDEPVIGTINKKVDMVDRINDLLLNKPKLIVGGTPNHKNNSWYTVVLDAKNNGNYFVLPWTINKNHRLGKDDIPVTIPESDGKTITTNRWLEELESSYINPNDFEEEILCKIWREKIVKEYI